MTTLVDIANRALQVPGTRTTVTDSELANNDSNEAIQINLAFHAVRKRLLRMAPWGCAMTPDNLVYISSVPGTPENSSAPATPYWSRGLPVPPWAYEYQYPVDCLQACFIVPADQAGYGATAIPITPAVTGYAPNLWSGNPVKFAVQTDQFRPVTAAAVAAGGTGHAVGDVLTLASGATDEAPIGAPVKLRVTAVSGGAITSVSVETQVIDANPALGGSYFRVQTNPVAQGSTTGSGTGATFNLTQGAAAPQRVILTNQPNALLIYVKDITDPNVFDDSFQEAFVRILGATITIPLSGDKRLANLAIQEANAIIADARTTDAGEGLTINDVTPDWIRVRGIDFGNQYNGPFSGFDWGGLWPIYG